ncbi:MAG: hypothetical protein EXX96DRAFT_571139 [Benjaminiella poitrasii]|nr:MAG: hypothetical protein EXX96DRAFT_571139 [Benjaminiella poitrasii]
MYLSNNFIISSLFVIASSLVKSAPVSSSSSYYPQTTIDSQNEFCLFLPPQPGLEVAVNEDNGIPFCTKKDLVNNSTEFPEGFITTAHYLRNSSYVQITGYFDREKYSLNATDGGGQYDNHNKGKPVGAQCKDYKYFVSMIEPDIERFCIRCCQEEEDCITGRSAYGCLRIIDGDYTRDNNFVIGNDSATSTHLNTNMNGVLAELEAFSSTADDTEVDKTTIEATTTANANDAIASEIKTLQESNQNASVEQIQTQWNEFSSHLATEYPGVTNQINQLNTIASSLTTTEQWQAFFDLVSEKIIQLQQADATATTEPTTSNTHTNSKEDLDWLFNHRESHDNQATW